MIYLLVLWWIPGILGLELRAYKKDKLEKKRIIIIKIFGILFFLELIWIGPRYQEKAGPWHFSDCHYRTQVVCVKIIGPFVWISINIWWLSHLTLTQQVDCWPQSPFFFFFKFMIPATLRHQNNIYIYIEEHTINIYN